MNRKKTGTGGVRRPTVALISRALNAAVRDAVELHKRAGLPMAVWQDGKVVLVPADDAASNGTGTKKRPRKTRRSRGKS